MVVGVWLSRCSGASAVRGGVQRAAMIVWEELQAQSLSGGTVYCLLHTSLCPWSIAEVCHGLEGIANMTGQVPAQESAVALEGSWPSTGVQKHSGT